MFFVELVEGIGEVVNFDLGGPHIVDMAALRGVQVLEGEYADIRTHVKCGELDEQLLTRVLPYPGLGVGVQVRLDPIVPLLIDNCIQDVHENREASLVYGLVSQVVLHGLWLAFRRCVRVAFVQLEIYIVGLIVSKDLFHVKFVLGDRAEHFVHFPLHKLLFEIFPQLRPILGNAWLHLQFLMVLTLFVDPEVECEHLFNRLER